MKKIKFPNFSSGEKLRIAISKSEHVHHDTAHSMLEDGRLCVAWNGSSDPVDESLNFGFLESVHERRGSGTTFEVFTDYNFSVDYEHCRTLDFSACPRAIAKREDGGVIAGRLIGFLRDKEKDTVHGIVIAPDCRLVTPIENITYADSITFGLAVEEEKKNG